MEKVQYAGFWQRTAALLLNLTELAREAH